MVDPSPTDSVMASEIFGPILPVRTVDSPDEAVDFTPCGDVPQDQFRVAA